MRLIKSDKEAFVRSVLDDVPQIDYQAQVNKLVNDWAISKLPEQLAECYAKHSHYFEHNYFSTPGGLSNVYIVTPNLVYNGKDVAPKLWGKLVEIADLKKEQSKKLDELESKLWATIDGCTTLKKAQERLPEFIKYLPTEREYTGTMNLPAVANLVTDLMVAGWPKGDANADTAEKAA